MPISQKYRRHVLQSKPQSINVSNLISKLRRIRIELYAMGDLVDGALERIEGKTLDNPSQPLGEHDKG
jgi:hypothetical protein